MPVDPNSMQLGITIEESAKLKKRIWAIFYTWDHAARRECSLLNISMKILRIAVQNQLAEFAQLR